MKQDYPLYKHSEVCEKCLCWESRTEERPLTAVSWHPAMAGATWLPSFLPAYMHAGSLQALLVEAPRCLYALRCGYTLLGMSSPLHPTGNRGGGGF